VKGVFQHVRSEGACSGFGIVLSLIIVTFVYVYLQAAPNEKATGIIVVLASPYCWIMVILVVALEAWFLMRHRAG